MATTAELTGRELDAAVAERVIGWQYGFCPYQRGPVTNRNGTISRHCLLCGKPRGYHNRWPAYSTDIAAAWQVVEKLEADGWGHKHLKHSASAELPGFSWRFMKPGEMDNSIVGATCDTAPEAICRAALKAVGECSLVNEAVTLRQTCYACPTQFEGLTADGQVMYVRYRWGQLTIQVGADLKDAVNSEPIYSVNEGDDMAGFMEPTTVFAHVRLAGYEPRHAD